MSNARGTGFPERSDPTLPEKTDSPVLIRADAGVHRGTGHVLRCLALAQAWRQASGRAVFAHAESVDFLTSRLQTEGFETVVLTSRAGSAEDADETAALAHRLGAKWIVADGYDFGAEFQRRICDAGFRLLILDDYGHAKHYHADLVLNQNLHASSEIYQSRDAGTRLLLGTEYTLFRAEFWPWRDWRHPIAARATRLLVTMGGSDPANVTGMVMQAISDLDDVDGVIIAGGAHQHFSELERIAASSRGTRTVMRDVSNMPELMAEADLAISGSGTTAWELAFMGLPAMLLPLADNQREVAAELDRRGIAVALEPDQALARMSAVLRELTEDVDRRSQMSERGRKIVDGYGADRVVSAMRSIS